MFGKKELDSLDEFKKAWDDAPERKAEAKDTGAVTNMDDFDYGDPVKDTADAKSITAASTPEVDSIASDDAKRAVQTTPAAIVPEAKPAMTFKQAFAAAYKSGVKTFDWEGKKFAAKMKSEMAKPAAVQTAKPAPAKAAEDQSAAESSRLANSKPTMAVSTGWLGNFIPPSLFGGDSSTDKPKVASVASKTKQEIAGSAPMRAKPETKPAAKDTHIAANGATVNPKNAPVDTKAIAAKLAVNPNTLLPNKPAVQMASSK